MALLLLSVVFRTSRGRAMNTCGWDGSASATVTLLHVPGSLGLLSAPASKSLEEALNITSKCNNRTRAQGGRGQCSHGGGDCGAGSWEGALEEHQNACLARELQWGNRHGQNVGETCGLETQTARQKITPQILLRNCWVHLFLSSRAERSDVHPGLHTRLLNKSWVVGLAAWGDTTGQWMALGCGWRVCGVRKGSRARRLAHISPLPPCNRYHAPLLRRAQRERGLPQPPRVRNRRVARLRRG